MTVKNFFADMVDIFFPELEIALLMQRVESVTHVFFSLITDAFPITFFLEEIIYFKYARITSSHIVTKLQTSLFS